MPSYYDLLGVPPHASLSDIKAAYRRLAVRYHPDRNNQDPQAEAQFKAISEAYRVLSEAALRAQYDYSLMYPEPPSITPPPRTPQRTQAPTNWQSVAFWMTAVLLACSLWVGGLFAYERYQSREELRKGQEALARGDSLGAYRYFELAVYHDDDLWQAHLQLAYLQVGLYNAHQLAFGHLTAVMALHPALPDSVYALRGLSALRLEKFKTARQDFQEAARLNPRKAEHWLLLGIAHYQAQDTLEACRTWAKAGPQGDSLRAQYCASSGVWQKPQ